MKSVSSQTSSIPSSLINDNEVEPVNQKFESFMPLAQEKQTELDETKEKFEEKQKIVDFQNQINAGKREKITGFEEQNQSKAQEIIQLEKAVKEKEELCEGSSRIAEKNPKNFLHRLFAWRKEKNEGVIVKENKITELQQEIGTCKKEAEKALQEKQKIIDLQDQIIAGNHDKNTDLEKQNQSKTQQITQLEKLVEEKQEIIDGHDNTIAENRDKIIVLVEQNQKREQQIIRLEKAIKENQKIIDGQANIIEEEKSEKAKIQIAYQEENNQLKNEIASLQTKVGKLDAAMTKKENQIAKLEADKETKASKVEQLKQKVSDLTKSHTDLVAKSTQTKNENVSMQTKIEESHAAIRQMESEVREKANQITELKETNSKLLNPNDIITVHRLNKLSEVEIFLNGILKDDQKKTFVTIGLCYDGTKWLDERGLEIRHDCSFCKIFVQQSLQIKSLSAAKFSPLINRLHAKSFCELYLEDLTISSKNFKNLVGKSNIHSLKIHRVMVKNEYKTLISAVQLMKEVPNVERFDYIFNDGESMEGLAQKFVKLPKFQKLCRFQLLNIQKGFDLEAFGQFIKKNAIKDGYWTLKFKVSKETFTEMARIRKKILSNLPSSFRLQIHNGDI